VDPAEALCLDLKHTPETNTETISMGGTVVVSPVSLLTMFKADVNPTLSIGVVHDRGYLDEPTFIVSE